MPAMADENKPDPVAAMFAIDDEQIRGRAAPEAEINAEPPADKPAPERDETGKFKGKEEKGEEKPPETKAEEKPAPEKQNDTVPLAKYMEEKRSLRAELEARDLTIKQINDRLAAFEKANAPKPEIEQTPDFVEDPKGYVDAKQAAIIKALEEANKKSAEQGEEAKKTAAHAAESVQIQRFMSDIQAHEARFLQTNPDYHDALNHVRQVRAAQLREFEPEITQEQINQVIRQEETTLAVQLARQGRDPVQTAYNLAHHYGYQKKAAAPAAEVAKLPEPTNKRLPPDQTLGGGAGAADTSEQAAPDAVDIALASLFKKRA